MTKKFFVLLAIVLGILGMVSICAAGAVEYVRVCSLYGYGFHYVPGTDVCMNDYTGDTRTETAGGTWRSLMPYPQGRWVVHVKDACGAGRLVKVGTYHSTDFAPNAYGRLQSAPFTLSLRSNEFISNVIMQGGFYDPRIPNRHGTVGTDALCVRSIDPSLIEQSASGPLEVPFGNGMLPIGCIANSRIVKMPAAYEVSATAAYPDIDAFFTNAQQAPVSGPYLYGTQLVITNDIDTSEAAQFQYTDATSNLQPMVGTVSVSVCVDKHEEF